MRRLLRVIVVAVGVALTAPWSADSASAAPAWTVQPLPILPNTDRAAFTAVDCVSDSLCTVVGWAADGSAMVPLAQRWNGGSSWTVQSAPKPGGTSPRFEGISCVAANPCYAVGSHVNGKVKAFSEKWNGTSWVLKAMLNPGGTAGDTAANDVSCTAGNACTAVGSFWNGTRAVALAEHWNGAAWSQQTVPNPSGALSATLQAVDCATASFCVAVGHYSTTSDDRRALIARWNGSAWALLTAPTPSGADGFALEGVSCTSASACTAVGYSRPEEGNYRTLVLRWNGSNWVQQTAPNVPNAQFTTLYDVSCVSATACTAVGYAEVDGADRKTLVERWNGTAWTISPTPTFRAGVAAELRGVDCSAAAMCTAVGFSKSGANPLRALSLRYA